MRYKFTAAVFMVIIFALGVVTISQLPALQTVYKENLPEAASLFDKIKTVIATADSGVNDILLEDKRFIEINGGFQRLIGRQIIEDAEERYRVIKMNNDQLTFVNVPFNEETEQIAQQSAQNLIDFEAFLKQKKIPFLYVEAPTKVDPYDPQLPAGLVDYTAQNSEMIRHIWQKAGIDMMVLNDEMHADGLDHQSLFFNTDHHWTPQGAFWAFGQLCQRLNDQYGFNIDMAITNLDQYQIETYKDYFLGSQGKRVGRLYSGLDDIDMITPKFSTDLTFELPWHGITKEGAFKETVMDYSHISERDLYEKNPYAAYTGGDFPINIIKNHNVEGKKVLLIRDSFGCAFVPFFSLAVEQLDILDLRYYTLSAKGYVEMTSPDMVIVMYNPGAYYNADMFEFDRQLGSNQ